MDRCHWDRWSLAFDPHYLRELNAYSFCIFLTFHRIRQFFPSTNIRTFNFMFTRGFGVKVVTSISEVKGRVQFKRYKSDNNNGRRLRK